MACGATNRGGRDESAMICKRRGEGGWEIIYQRNHALLAAEMLADWPEEERPQPWFQLLNACSQHDHGWMENEKDPLVDEYGHPVDFLHMTTESSITMSRRNLRNAEAQSRWCGILVARHLEYLFGFKNEPGTEQFVAEVRGLRHGWMGEIGESVENVEQMYELLCWADTLSLLVCCQPSEFTESLRLKAQGQEYQAREVGEGVWTVEPWPYRHARLHLDYEVRLLKSERFETADALRDALASSHVIVRRLELCR